MLEIGICDDEEVSRSQIQEVVNGYLRMRGLEANITVYSGAEDLLRRGFDHLQILLLDVVMEGMDGIHVAREVRVRNPELLLAFVSAWLDYSTMGYRVKASAYILKNRLKTQLPAALDMIIAELPHIRKVVSVNSGGATVDIPVYRIYYAESQGRNVLFHGATILEAQMRFTDVADQLSKLGFLRIHRCYCVNLSHVLTFQDGTAILENGDRLPCSRGKTRDFQDILLRWKAVHF